MTLIPWLGETRYPIVSLRHAFEITLGKMFQAAPSSTADVEMPYFKSISIQWGGIDPNADLRMWTTPSEQRELSVRVGDLLICEGGDAGRSAIYNGPQGFTFEKSVHRARPRGGSDIRYLGYVLQALHSSGWLDVLCNKATIRHLTSEKLKALEIPLPPVDDQHRIANFLDVETEKLDELISKKRHLVTLMNEHIDSRVLQQVGASRIVDTAAIDAALPIRRILTKVIRPPVADVGIITAYRDGQVTDRTLRRSEGYTMSASPEPQGQHVQMDDVVIHGLDGFAGAIGTSEAIGNCSRVYHVCVPQGDGDARYLGRILRLLALQGYLGNFAISTRERAVDFRNWDLFGRIPIPAVPAAEQREVGKLIEKVRPLHETIERSARLAAERRQALITAAVTGQFDVSTASGRNVTDGVSA
ncbi:MULTISPECIES: restriction endonuclease subunit S [Streptomyces]|uniref:restriction endonuclease subunit S n=1 Tax=Streptomyces TaxID=1883 RepID=UPI0033224652